MSLDTTPHLSELQDFCWSKGLVILSQGSLDLERQAIWPGDCQDPGPSCVPTGCMAWVQPLICQTGIIINSLKLIIN